MTEAIVIRPAGADDFKTIASIFHDAVRQVAIRDYTQEQVEAWSPSEHSVEHWVKRTAALKVRLAALSETPATAAGFIGFADDGFIDLLFTRPEFLRRGIARSLLRDAESDLQKNCVARAYANVSLTARPFFEAMGYRSVKSQRVWCRSVEFQNFRMEKNLITP